MTRAVIFISDPFELSSLDSSGRTAELIDSYLHPENGRGSFLLRLDEPLQWNRRSYVLLVGQARYVDELDNPLPTDEDVPFNFVATTKELAEGGFPWGAPHWKEHLGAIGSLRLISAGK